MNCDFVMLARAQRRLATAGRTQSQIPKMDMPHGDRQPGMPMCITKFGHEEQVHFVQHPGVMAVSRLLELRWITRMRATFTPQQVIEMGEYDEEVAALADIACQNNLSINFIDMEKIEENLPRLIKEKEQLAAAREAVMALPKGNYNMPDVTLDAVEIQPKKISAAARAKIAEAASQIKK